MGMLLLNGSTDLNPRELFANGEQGLWLDPSDMTAGKTGWRRNLLTYSEGLVTQFGLTDQVTNASTSISGFSNSIQFGNNSVLRYCYNVYTTILNASYTVSIFVQMDDDSIPSVGSSTTTGDFSLIAVNSILSGVTVSLVSGSTYRISKTFTGDGASRNIGIIKYTGQSAKTFRVTGYQLELGSLSEYQPITDFSTEFKQAFPLHTLYQDSNGVTPCTAAGDPVGLILDQSRGGLGALGPELVTNGGFDADTNWTKGTGWTITGGLAVATSATAFSSLSQNLSFGASKFIKIRVTATINSGTVYVQPSSGAAPATIRFLSAGVNDFILITGASGSNFQILAGGGGFDGTIDNISVREVPGNHAYQTTSASRPTLARIPSSGRRNLITYTEQMDNAAWQKVQTGTALVPVITPNTAIAPDGTLTADTAVFDLNGGSHISQLQQAPTVTSQQYTWSFYAKTTDGTSKVFQIAGPVGTGSAITITGDWQRFSQTGTGNGTCRVRLNGAASTASTASIHIWGAQLETGSTVSNYQKVVATTDVTESGFADLWHLVFDGSDDSLVTNSVDFTATDEMTVIAGVRKLSDATRGTVCELTATIASNNGAFHLTAPNAASATYAFESNGTSLTDGVASSVTAPLTSVISGSADISGDSNVIRVNGTQSDSDTGDQGTGNYSNAVIYIGRRGGSSLPFNGHLYQLIIRGKTTSGSKLLEAERFAGKKTGVSF